MLFNSLRKGINLTTFLWWKLSPWQPRRRQNAVAKRMRRKRPLLPLPPPPLAHAVGQGFLCCNRSFLLPISSHSFQQIRGSWRVWYMCLTGYTLRVVTAFEDFFWWIVERVYETWHWLTTARVHLPLTLARSGLACNAINCFILFLVTYF